MNYLLLLVGLALITICAELLTRGCVGMAARFRVPEFIVGLTVMAVGTSMPELTVSFLSAVEGNSDMAIGNVTGSNLFNTLIILGLCSLFRPMDITRENIRRDIPLSIGASLVLLFVCADEFFGWRESGYISRGEALVMLAMYVSVVYYSIRSARTEMGSIASTSSESATATAPTSEEACSTTTDMSWWKIVGFILIGLAGLIWGGEICLSSATEIARAWGVSEAVIAVTIIAAGTSLPELASSLAAMASGKTSLALGNIIGSNVANILLILGASGTVMPLTMGGIAMSDIVAVALSALLLLLSAIFVGKRQITRLEGLAYLTLYVVYVISILK